jgi:hypothetical protein
LVDGRSVTTDEHGWAVVSIDEYGPHTVSIRPGPVDPSRSQPVYASEEATVVWHPLATTAGWIDLVSNLLGWSIFGMGIVYAGRRIGQLIQPTDDS